MEDYLKGREIRTVVKDEKSQWKKVKNGVPHNILLSYYIIMNTLVSLLDW